ncbi:MAG: HAMP domain-containing histidine kinase [Comamonadaceae bacterium]|nr:MAG: HAMP domain-containing histidine kinase [Comamonadaceae bacterium]
MHPLQQRVVDQSAHAVAGPVTRGGGVRPLRCIHILLHPMKSLRDYGFAFAAVAGALLLRYLLNPILGQQGPYLILTLPIVLAALYGGFGPAVFATVLGTSAGTYLFIGRGAASGGLLEPANIGRTVLFLIIGISIAFIGGRLAQSRAELAASVRQLRASNRAKDSAMVTLGHEIRNPLSAIHAAQNLLKRVPDDAKRVAWASDLIGRQVLQMKRMADDLVDLSSVLKGGFSIEHRPVDMQQVLAQALEQCDALITRKGHRLRQEMPATSLTTNGDHHRLVQVFANLVNNAAKYTPPGGDLFLQLEAVADGGIVVTVRDTGTGMQPELIDELFEPFVQAPGVGSSAEGGLGLGLALVKRLVTLHGGTVRGWSAGHGLGSTFTVTLPAYAGGIIEA